MFKTIIRFKSKFKKEIEKIASDINKKDKTFVYSMEEDKLIIENKSEIQAKRRRGWFFAVFHQKPLKENKEPMIIYSLVKEVENE